MYSAVRAIFRELLEETEPTSKTHGSVAAHAPRTQQQRSAQASKQNKWAALHQPIDPQLKAVPPAIYQNSERAQILHNFLSSSTCNAMVLAIKAGNLEDFKKCFAPVSNYSDFDKPLIQGAILRNLDAFSIPNKPDIYNQFIDFLAERLGLAPLHYAIYCNNLPVVKNLLANNAINVNARDVMGRTTMDFVNKFKSSTDGHNQIDLELISRQIKSRGGLSSKELEWKEDTAATKIQAVWRGHLQRSNLTTVENSNTYQRRLSLQLHNADHTLLSF